MHRRFGAFLAMVGVVAIGAGLYAASIATARPTSSSYIHSLYLDFGSTEAAFRTGKTPSSSLATPVGVLVNHHLLASSFIRDTLNHIRPGAVQRVILISPNHFLAGRAPVQTASQDFLTPYGVVHVDQALVKKFLAGSVVHVQNSSFIQEHGVYNILPYLARQLPWATVTPIIIKDGTSAETLAALRRTLDAELRPGTLVIGSFDFSHYQTSAVADAQDASTLRVIQSIGRDATDPISVDSSEGLRLVLDLMRDVGAKRFELVHHSNSGKLTRSPADAQTTSYLTGLFWR